MSSYYYVKKRQAEPTARELRDVILKEKIMEVWKDRKKGREVYGARKVWLKLNQMGIPVARCTVERLMRELGISGVKTRRKRPRTTVPGDPAERPSDKLERCFTAPAPNRRWVADITYVMTFSGWVYTSFIMDLYSRRVIGWQVADNLRSDLALDALEMAVWARRHDDLDGLVHHSDRGVQGEFNRSSQHLHVRWANGATTRMGGCAGGAAGDAFAGPASGGQAGRAAAVLGSDRQGNTE